MYDSIMMMKVRYQNLSRGVAGRVRKGLLQGEAIIRFMIRGWTLIPCITTGIARRTLQRFYDYPGSDEPSDGLVQIQEHVEECLSDV